MKNILLSTTALTLTAGIAAADVSVSGSFKLGFNDTGATGTTAPVETGYTTNPLTGAVTQNVRAAGSADWIPAPTGDNNYGVYNDAGITFAMSSTMDSGMTVAATVDMNGGDTVNNAADAYTLSLASDGMNVSFGSTEYSARSAWTAAGDMATDGWFNQNDAGGNVLKADVTLGGLAISASAMVAADTNNASPNPLSIAISGSLGGASYVIANEGSMMGIAATTAVGGATVTTAYSSAPSATTNAAAAIAASYPGEVPVVAAVAAVARVDSTTKNDTSTGISISYPMGAVTTTVAYSMESVATGGSSLASDSWNIAAAYSAGGTSVTFKTDEASSNSVEGSITLGGATVFAGLADGLDDMYLAVSNPLGGGASIMASYAIDEGTDAADEVGAGDYQEGLTVELSFTF